MAIIHWRHLWHGAYAGYFTFYWDAIRHDSYVAVTVAEGARVRWSPTALSEVLDRKYSALRHSMAA